MNPGTGEPRYYGVIHEMGHNFSLEARSMNRLMGANGGRICGSGFCESVASLPIIFMDFEISLNGEKYDILPGSYEWNLFNDSVQSGYQDDFDVLVDFESLITSGQVEGVFDTSSGLFDGVIIFCAFFQAYLYEFEDYSTPYGHDLIRRFFNIFDDEEIPDFESEKAETYFAAGFSAAAGQDLREKAQVLGLRDRR